jgi:hypothetical protein
MIYNKSGHPVEVKKISIRLWSIRDEIEAAIGRRMKECEAAGVPLYVDDIKKFYNLNLKEPLNQQNNVLPLHPETEVKAEAAPVETPAQETPPQDAPKEEQEAAPAPAVSETPEANAEVSATPEASQTLSEADKIIEEQNKQGLDTKKPNPILERPYTRQAPDLDKISYGFALLADINMDTLLTFTKDKFLHGQSVVVEFLIPQNFLMTATVTYCSFYAIRSRVISTTKPDYRVQCRFDFSVPGERDTLRNFLKSVEPSIPQPVKKAKKEAEDDSLGI